MVYTNEAGAVHCAVCGTQLRIDTYCARCRLAAENTVRSVLDLPQRDAGTPIRLGKALFKKVEKMTEKVMKTMARIRAESEIGK